MSTAMFRGLLFRPLRILNFNFTRRTFEKLAIVESSAGEGRRVQQSSSKFPAVKIFVRVLMIGRIERIICVIVETVVWHIETIEVYLYLLTRIIIYILISETKSRYVALIIKNRANTLGEKTKIHPVWSGLRKTEIRIT